jgi:hypothetical protein
VQVSNTFGDSVGRQLPIVATPEDERSLLDFVASLSPIRIFLPFAKSPEGLWCDDWQRHDIPGYSFNIWLVAFSWQPEFAMTGGTLCTTDRKGQWYVANTSVAPVLEVLRPLQGQRRGRVYWSKDFAATEPLQYDVVSFSKVVDKIWGWIRKHGRRTGDARSLSPYYLPNAWVSAGIA